MSGNSCASALQTVPIVIDFAGARPPRLRRRPCPRPGPARRSAARHRPGVAVSGSPSACVERQLVLADLHLIALLQALGLDPRAVHVGAVQRAAVIQMPLTGALDQQAWSRETVTSSRNTSESGRRPMLMRSPATGKLSPTRPPPARITSAGPCAVTCSSSTGTSSPASSIRYVAVTGSPSAPRPPRAAAARRSADSSWRPRR